MTNGNNVARANHLEAAAKNIKRYILAEISDVTDALLNDLSTIGGAKLSTTPATQNGGLWYEIQNSKPVIKFFHDGRSYSIATTIVPISPQLTITPSSAAIGASETATAKVSYLGSGTISVSGGATYNATTKTISYRPEVHDNGTKIFTVSLSESYGYTSASATFTVNIQAVAKNTPTLEFESDSFTLEALVEGISFNYDGDGDLSLSAVGSDDHDVSACFTLDADNQIITFEDDGECAEFLPITLILSSAETEQYDAATATITIEEV